MYTISPIFFTYDYFTVLHKPDILGWGLLYNTPQADILDEYFYNTP